MSTIKRKVNGEWVNILATPATQVFTSNPVLGYPEGTDIESLFMSQQSDIDLLKKNVAWLALHGGGGSGGGGGFGGGSGTMSIIFLNPNNTLEQISALTWSQSYTSIPLRISATGMSGTFSVNLFVDGVKQTTIRNKKRNEVFWIDKQYLGIAAGQEATILVSATAVNSEGTESDPVSLSISFPSLKLYTPNAGETVKYAMSSIENHEVSMLMLQYQCNLPGEYRIFYSRGDMRPDSGNNICVNGIQMTSEDALIKFPNMLDPEAEDMTCPPYITVNVRNSGINSATIPIISQECPVGSGQYYHGILNKDGSNVAPLVPGTYTYSFLLQSVDTLSLMSNTVSQTFAILTSTSLTISPVAGAEVTQPLTVNQQAMSKIGFVLYCEGSATADYRVMVSLPKADGSFNPDQACGAYQDGEWQRSAATPSQVTNFELSWNIIFDNDHLGVHLEEGIQPIVLRVECSRNGITGFGDIYINVQSQTSAAVMSYMTKLSHFCVFDFTPWYTSDKFYLNDDGQRVTPGIIRAFNPNVTNNVYTYRSMGIANAALPDNTTEHFNNFVALYAGDPNYSDLCTQTMTSRTGIYGEVRNSINSVATWTGYDIGSESGHKTLYYALQHHAYAVIKPGTSKFRNASNDSITSMTEWFNSIPKTSASLQSAVHKDPPNSRGSLEIAYSIENVISDDHIILQMGYDVINSTNANEYGFIITPHKAQAYFFGGTVSCVPVDNSFNHIVFTWDTESITKTIKLYYNGKLAGIKILDSKIDAGTAIQLAAWNAVYLGVGCSNPGNLNTAKPDGRFTNVNVYTCRMFNVPMNYGEVVASYINNAAAYNSLTGDELNAPWITSKILNNNIQTDTEMTKSTGENTVTVNGAKLPNVANVSSTFNFLSGTFKSFLSVTADGSGIALQPAISSLPIPVVVVTSQQWSFLSFTSSNNPGPDNNCTFRYYASADAGSGDSNSGVITIQGVTMEFQGTSTLGYYIKNVELTMPEGIAFQPNFDFLPESSFVLKADVVDSGHFNNAVIGTYINEIAMQEPAQSKLYDTQVYKIRDMMIDMAKNKKIPVNPDKAFKANIEGFPCLFVIDFYNADNQTHDIKPLGIYSFNLGRSSHKNQGLKWTTDYQYYDSKDQLVPYAANPTGVGSGPMKWKEPSINDADRPYNAYCFEGADSTSCGFAGVALSSDYDQVLIKVKSNAVKPKFANGVCTNVTDLRNDPNEGWHAYKLVNPQIPPGQSVTYCYDTLHQTYYKTLDTNQNIPYNQDNVVKLQITPTGYFWSPDASYASEIFFSNRQSTGAQQPTVDEMVGHFNTYICKKFGYNKAGIIREMDSRVPYYIAVQGSESSGTVTFKQNETEPYYSIDRIQSTERANISFTNIGFYYVICMLFGLVDSFGKNMQYKAWMTKGTQSTDDTMGDAYWTPAFYDMDTAFGIDNTGLETISVDMWDESLIDAPDGSVEFIYGMAPGLRHSFATVYSNKIFGIVTSPVNYTQWGNQGTDCYGPEGDNQVAAPYLYSRIWAQLREKYIADTDEWVDKYISTRYETVPELIMNYDYDMKYVSPGTSTMANFMHGDRINYIRQWLKKRVYFLDSVFGYYHYYYNNSDTNATFLTQNDNTKLGLYMVPYNMSCRFTYNATDQTRFNVTTSQPLVVYNAANNVNNRSFMYSDGKNAVSLPANATGGEALSIQGWLYNMPLITSIDFHVLKPVSIEAQGQYVKMENNGIASGNRYTALGSTSPFFSNYGNFQALAELDWSSIKSFSPTTSFSFFELFKTWDKTNIGKNVDYAQLERVDLSNVNIPNATIDFAGPAIPSNSNPKPPEEYKNIFKNLISINLTDARIQSVVVPETSTLTELYVRGSSITSLSLTGQPLLKQLDLTGCSSLNTLNIKDAELIPSITIGSDCVSIKEVNIQGMPSLTSLVIKGGDSRIAPTLVVKDCPKLKTIEMSGFTEDNGNSGCTRDDFTLQNCPGLESINLYNSKIYTVLINCGKDDATGDDLSFREAYPKLRTINMSYTAVKKFRLGGDKYMNATASTAGYDSTVVDLRNIVMCNRITNNTANVSGKPTINSTDPAEYVSVSLYNNQAVETVYLSNEEGKPNLSYGHWLGECRQLKHVYGSIKGTHAFYNCTALTFFTGKDDYLYTDNDAKITQSGGANDYKTAPYNINVNGGSRSRFVTEFGSSGPSLSDGVPFRDNSNGYTVPNTMFNCELTGSAQGMFYNTRCAYTASYLILWNSPELTGLNYTFQNIKDPSGAMGVSTANNIKRNNTFHMHMFRRNTKLTSIVGVYYGASHLGFIPYFSPEFDVSGNPLEERKGLFGYCPNLTTISVMSYNAVTAHDNHIFDLNPKLTSLNGFSYIDLALDNINTLFLPGSAKYMNIDVVSKILGHVREGSWTSDGYTFRFGNYAGIFRNNKQLNNINNCFRDSYFINWNCFEYGQHENESGELVWNTTNGQKNEPLGLTSKVTSVNQFMLQSSGSGKVNVKNLCAVKADGSWDLSWVENVTTIVDSFAMWNTNDNSLYPILEMRNMDENGDVDSFGLFHKLSNVNNSNTSGNPNVVPFTGYKKQAFWNDVQHGLFINAFDTLVTFKSMFNGCEFLDYGDSSSTPIQLPGEFYKPYKKLTNINNAFSDIKFPNYPAGFSLSTNMPFKRETGAITNMSYLFSRYNSYMTSTSGDQVLHGGIPVGFMYSGGTTETVTLIGTNEEREVIKPETPLEAWTASSPTAVIGTSDVIYTDTVATADTTDIETGEITAYGSVKETKYYVKLTNLCTYDSKYYWNPRSSYAIIAKSVETFNDGTTSKSDSKTYNSYTLLPASVKDIIANILSGNEDSFATDILTPFTPETIEYSYFKPNKPIIEAIGMFRGNTLKPYTVSYKETDLYNKVIDSVEAFEEYITHINSELCFDYANPQELTWKYKLAVYTGANYNPFKYTYKKVGSSVQYQINSNPNHYKYTLLWSYDGDFYSLKKLGESLNTDKMIRGLLGISASDEGLIEYQVDDIDINKMMSFGNSPTSFYIKKMPYYAIPDGTTIGNTGVSTNYVHNADCHYFCTPDLLRYIGPSSNGAMSEYAVQSMFENCGSTMWNYGNTYTNDSTLLLQLAYTMQRGINGRIPPHLFSELPKITNYSSMFSGCKMLSGYITEDGSNTGTYKLVIIPSKLFSYVNMRGNSVKCDYMFAYGIWPGGTDFNVWTGFMGTNLSVYMTFAGGFWGKVNNDNRGNLIYLPSETEGEDDVEYQLPSTVTVRQVFPGVNITNATACFARYPAHNGWYTSSGMLTNRSRQIGKCTIKKDNANTTFSIVYIPEFIWDDNSIYSQMSGNVIFEPNIFGTKNMNSSVYVFGGWRFGFAMAMGNVTTPALASGEYNGWCQHFLTQGTWRDNRELNDSTGTCHYLTFHNVPSGNTTEYTVPIN